MKKILIVEDDPGSAHTLVQLLRAEHKLMVATNGAQALELAEQQAPDLILLDVVMPELNGFMVCDVLKKRSRWQKKRHEYARQAQTMCRLSQQLLQRHWSYAVLEFGVSETGYCIRRSNMARVARESHEADRETFVLDSESWNERYEEGG